MALLVQLPTRFLVRLNSIAPILESIWWLIDVWEYLIYIYLSMYCITHISYIVHNIPFMKWAIYNININVCMRVIYEKLYLSYKCALLFVLYRCVRLFIFDLRFAAWASAAAPSNANHTYQHSPTLTGVWLCFCFFLFYFLFDSGVCGT